MPTAASPTAILWQRFCRRPLAVGSLAALFLMVLLALLGYGIAPDATPNANRQLPDIALQGVGYTVNLLPIYLQQPPVKQSFVARCLWGTPDTVHYQPVNADKVRRNDSLFFTLPNTDNQIITLAFAKNAVDTTHIYTHTFLLGTDALGRCLFSRLLIGLRVSLSVGLFAVLLSVMIGSFVGAIAGYYGGKIDRVAMLCINVLWSVPTLLLVFALVLALGRGYWQIFVAIGCTMWIDVARMVRSQVQQQRALQYVEAARSLGFGHFRILFRHILPNVFNAVLVLAAANFAQAILLESGLSYLGFGIQAPTPSWGTLLSENYGLLLSNNPLPALAPALAITFTVLCFYLISNTLAAIRQ
jgi:ABC-type dipeptide/oligopeptide/nickel transport system permease subunit